MRTFAYERPSTLAEALSFLSVSAGAVRPLAGGTDLIIRLRDGTIQPATVLDLKGIRELRRRLDLADGVLTIGATTVMTDIAADEQVQRHFVALAEAAVVVGSVQIRNRATLAGNICNASPAADTATPLLVYGALVVIAGTGGIRRVALDDFFVRSGTTTLRADELVTSIELPVPTSATGAVHLRRTRRRGHDLAAVTMSCLIDERGVTRLAYGSVGPRPTVFVDESGILADPGASDEVRAAVFARMFAPARPSPRSMRSSPEYRLAMLGVLGRRAVAIARDRLVRA